MKTGKILFEDDCCLALHKPAGLAVQGGAGISVCVETILTKRLGGKPYLVHRLDRDTSGVLLTAKTKEAAAFFSKNIAGGGARKQYLAVCAHKPDADKLGKSGILKNALSYRTQEKTALTKYRVLDEVSDDYGVRTIFELELGTGRMHQIRRHLAGAGFPILGDEKYGDWKFNKTLRKQHTLKHLLLHAARLVIPHPAGGVLDLSAPLPEYWFASGLVPQRVFGQSV